MTEPCAAYGCDRPRRSGKAELCGLHYGRQLKGYAPRFPVEPMLEYARRRGVVLPDMPAKTLTLRKVDDLCIDVFGVHPIAVYGDLYYDIV